MFKTFKAHCDTIYSGGGDYTKEHKSCLELKDKLSTLISKNDNETGVFTIGNNSIFPKKYYTDCQEFQNFIENVNDNYDKNNTFISKNSNNNYVQHVKITSDIIFGTHLILS